MHEFFSKMRKLRTPDQKLESGKSSTELDSLQRKHKELHFPTKSFEVELADYPQMPIILSEIENAQEEVKKLGIQPERIILFGSGAKKELRTKDDDPDDPSDIDLLILVSESDMDILSQKMHDGKTRLSRSRSSGSTSYLVKRPSVSNKLNDTEIVICSLPDLETMYNSDNKKDRDFFSNALREGLRIKDH